MARTAVVLGGLMLMPMLAHAAMLLSADFEGGGGACPPGFTTAQSTHNLSVSTARARNGSSSHRTQLNYGDAHPDRPGQQPKHRAECGQSASSPEGAERWYGFSIYPESLPRDTRYEALFQVLQNRGNWGSVNPNDEIIAIDQLFTENGQWGWRGRDPKGGWIWDYLGAYQTGRWTDWVIHAIWSDRSDGLLELWKDGAKVKTYRGPNLSPDVSGSTNVKFGIYKPNWDEGTQSQGTPRIVYHDALKIMDGSGSYALVAPSGTPAEETGAPAPPPTPPLPPPTLFRLSKD